MRYHQTLVLFAIATFPRRSLTTPSWDDMHTKHSWTTVPSNWESIGCPPAGTTIDLYVALKPHHENALIDVLYEVSDPTHRKHVLYTIPFRTHILMCVAVPEQIRRIPDKGGGG